MSTSVVIATFDSRRLNRLLEAIGSLRRQVVGPQEIIVAVDRNPALAERLNRELPSVTVVTNTKHPGAGGARNAGAAAATGQILAFLDDDAVASPDWIKRIEDVFLDADVMGTGGFVDPAWLARHPRWFPSEFGWVVGCSYTGLPVTREAVRNVFAGNMAIRRDLFEALGGFRAAFGKNGSRSEPEETDLCIRARLLWPSHKWIYDPAIRIRHTVPASHGHFRYFVRRCLNEGIGKGSLASLVGTAPALDVETAYVRTVLPRGFIAGLGQFLFGRDPYGLLRAGAIATGLLVTAFGYGIGRAVPAVRELASDPRKKRTNRQPDPVIPRASSSGFSPKAVLSVDIADRRWRATLLDELDDSDCEQALVLVRMCGEPLGTTTLTRLGAQRDPDSLLLALEGEIRQAEARHGHRLAASASECRWRASRAETLRHARTASVVICTRGRPERLRLALETVADLRYPTFELVLVDNAPRDDANERVVRSFRDRIDVTYVVEPVPGLSRARNRALRASRHEIVAFTDDDVLLDREWLLGIEHTLRSDSRLGAVSGPVLPAELETEAQQEFERRGGHSKARGFVPAMFDGHVGGQSPYFPRPPFGVGCNMAFQRAALEQIGAFDEALGQGTASRACEDTAVFSELLLHGWKCAYSPAALIWHFHRTDVTSLDAQRRDYGIGMGAFYAALITRDPRRLRSLLRLTPTALRAMGRSGQLGIKHDTSWTVDRRALIRGPLAYLAERRRTRRRIEGNGEN